MGKKMAKSDDSFEYRYGPDWKPGPYGQQFKPRIVRALDRFVQRAEEHEPNLISAISPIDLSRTNPWVRLIAQALWSRLAPEAGVALLETDISPANLWPTSTRKGTTLDGREYWVQNQPANLGRIALRLVRGSPLNPAQSQDQSQKVEVYPKVQPVFLTIKRGAKGYPLLSTFGAKAGTEREPEYSLGDWVTILEIIHLYGRELTLKGDDRIFLGANPLDLGLIAGVEYKIRADLHDKQNGKPPRFFMGVIRPGQPPTHQSTGDLMRALIGWEIAALAIESLKGASAPKAREGLSDGDLAVLQKTLYAIQESQAYVVARQMQAVQKGSRGVINGLSPDTRARASDRDLEGHLRDLEEVLDEVDQTVQDKEIPEWLTGHITKFQEAKGALAQATPEDKENFRRSLALSQAKALEQQIQTGDKKAARERRMLADKTPGHYRVLLWDAESSLNGLRQSKYTSREEVKREEARVKALAEKADEQDRTLALGSTAKNLNTFVSTLDARSGGAAYKALTGMINIGGSVMTKAAWITELVQNGAPLAVNFNSLPRKRDEGEDDYFDGNEGDTEDTTKVSPEYIIGRADDRYTLGAYGFAFAQYLGAPWIKPPENAIVFDDFAFANAKRMNKAAEQILSSPKYQGLILSAQAAGAKVSPVLLSIAAKG